MDSLATLIGLAIFAIASVVVTASAVRDLVRKAPFGSTIRGWLRHVTDAFFSIG